MAAITTGPWSMLARDAFSSVRGTGSVGHSWISWRIWAGGGTSRGPLWLVEIGSLAEQPGRGLVESALHGRGLRCPLSGVPERAWAASPILS